MPASPPDQPSQLPGVPDNNKGRGIIGAAEMVYVLFPWLVPGVRAEYTLLDSSWGKGSFLRILPGATVLLRPNIRVYLVGDIEHAYKLPPASPSYTNTWGAAGGSVVPAAGSGSKTEVEQISATLAWAL